MQPKKTILQMRPGVVTQKAQKDSGKTQPSKGAGVKGRPTKEDWSGQAMAKVIKGKGKASMITLEGGQSWVFGKRGTFQEGSFQDQHSGQRHATGPNNYWRSGTGRYGSRCQGSNRGWSNIHWAPKGDRNKRAFNLFHQNLPLNAKPEQGYVELNGCHDSWILHYRSKALREVEAKGKGAKGKTGKTGKA